MDFVLNDDQEIIRASAVSFLADNSDSPRVRAAQALPDGFDPALWNQAAAELGWCATDIPEDQGGLGLSLVEVVLLTEQMGYRMACLPYFATSALAAAALREAGDPERCADVLGRIAGGELIVAAAFSPDDIAWRAGSVAATAKAAGDAWVLDGEARCVLHGGAAEMFVVAARKDDGATGLFLVQAGDAGVGVTRRKTIDETRPYAILKLSGVKISSERDVGRARGLEAGLEKATAQAMVALAAEQVGAAQACLDLTVAYVAERKQFGRVVGSFQAIKHRCAEMMVRIESSRSLAYGAACRLAAVAGELSAEDVAEAEAAKSFATDALFFCAQEAIQLHGGVGFTWEYDPQLYFKRAQATAAWFGSSATLRERLLSRVFG
ncbi:MAG TPA: acyl-CoA dehydrogenase family protein [Rhodocyclaceae bacterium]|nr:acyl-CoA dehydrogenase family protein [Rhodocyclaceae bacterium]